MPDGSSSRAATTDVEETVMLFNQTAMRISSGRIVIGGVLTLVVAIGIANRVRAGEGCCAHCAYETCHGEGSRA